MSSFSINFGQVTTESQQEDADFSISTSSPVAFDTDWSLNMVDSFFKGQALSGRYRNMLSQPYFGMVDDLNSKFIFPSVGQVANTTHYSFSSNAYNFDPANFPTPVGETFDECHNGVATITWSHDFVQDGIAFKNAIGRNCDVCVNVYYGTLAEITSYVAALSPKRIVFGAELQTYENASWTRANYKTTVETWIASLTGSNPNILTCLNGGLIYKTNNTTVNWNNTVSTIVADEVSNYWQLGDRLSLSSNNQNNLIQIDNYFDMTLPMDMDNLATLYTGKRIYIGEMNVEDNRGGATQYINNKMLGLYAIARYFEYAINHTATISGVSWMSQKNLIDGDDVGSNNYYILKNLLTLTGTSVGTVSFGTNDDLTGSLIFTGGAYKMLVNNGSDNDFILSSININGTPTTKVFTNLYSYSPDWADEPIFGTVTQSAIQINRHSVNVISF